MSGFGRLRREASENSSPLLLAIDDPDDADARPSLGSSVVPSPFSSSSRTPLALSGSGRRLAIGGPSGLRPTLELIRGASSSEGFHETLGSAHAVSTSLPRASPSAPSAPRTAAPIGARYALAAAEVAAEAAAEVARVLAAAGLAPAPSGDDAAAAFSALRLVSSGSTPSSSTRRGDAVSSAASASRGTSDAKDSAPPPLLDVSGIQFGVDDTDTDAGGIIYVDEVRSSSRSSRAAVRGGGGRPYASTARTHAAPQTSEELALATLYEGAERLSAADVSRVRANDDGEHDDGDVEVVVAADADAALSITTTTDPLGGTQSSGGPSSLGSTMGRWRITAGGTLRMGGFMALNRDGIKEVRGAERLAGVRGGLGGAVARGHVQNELIILEKIGSGASGIVSLALHVPTLSLIAVKQIRMFDSERRAQTVTELKALYGNMLPLVPVRARRAPSVAPSGALSPRSEPSAVSPFTSPTRSFLARPAALAHGDGGSSNSSGGGGGGLDETALSLGASLGASVDFGGDGTLGASSASAPSVDDDVCVAAAPPSNVVRLFDAFVDDGAVALVLEYAGSGSLERVIEAGGLRDERGLARLAAHGLRALVQLHTVGLLHRDIKPANLLLSTGGEELKVSDFGISTTLASADALANTWVGTMAFMAPERVLAASSESATSVADTARGAHGAGGRTAVHAAAPPSPSGGYGFPSDVWAMGLSLLSVALGRVPWLPVGGAAVEAAAEGFSGGGGYWDLLKAIRDDPAPLHLLDSAFAAAVARRRYAHVVGAPSPQLVDFFARCLTKDPAKRATAVELLVHPFIAVHTDACPDGQDAFEWVASRARVGVPLSECEELVSLFPGGFHLLSTPERASREAVLGRIVAALVSREKWPVFVAFFRRWRNRKRKKAFYGLEEAALNQTLAARMTSLSDTLGAAARAPAVIDGGVPRALSERSLRVGDSAVRPIVPPAPALPPPAVTAALRATTTSGGPSASTMSAFALMRARGDVGIREVVSRTSVAGADAPPSFFELELGQRDVVALAAALEIPSIMVLGTLNDAIRKRCDDDIVEWNVGAGGKSGAMVGAGPPASRGVHASPSPAPAPATAPGAAVNVTGVMPPTPIVSRSPPLLRRSPGEAVVVHELRVPILDDVATNASSLSSLAQPVIATGSGITSSSSAGHARLLRTPPLSSVGGSLAATAAAALAAVPLVVKGGDSVTTLRTPTKAAPAGAVQSATALRPLPPQITAPPTGAFVSSTPAPSSAPGGGFKSPFAHIQRAREGAATTPSPAVVGGSGVSSGTPSPRGADGVARVGMRGLTQLSRAGALNESAGGGGGAAADGGGGAGSSLAVASTPPPSGRVGEARTPLLPANLLPLPPRFAGLRLPQMTSSLAGTPPKTGDAADATARIVSPQSATTTPQGSARRAAGNAGLVLRPLGKAP